MWIDRWDSQDCDFVMDFCDDVDIVQILSSVIELMTFSVEADNES